VFKVMREEGFPEDAVRLLERLYSGQKGRVRGQSEGACFDIGRGTKEGDPLSSRVFNLVISHMMRKLRTAWKTKGYGYTLVDEVIVDSEYADDVLIVAKTRQQLGHMIEDLVAMAREYGLRISWIKTKAMYMQAQMRSPIRVGALGELREVPVVKEFEYIPGQAVFGWWWRR